MPRALVPATQPTAVTTAGIIVAVPVPSAYRDYPIDRIVVVQTAGAAASYTVELSEDPAVATRALRIASFSGATPAAPLDSQGTYTWGATENIYVKVVPNTGSDNAYTIRLFIDATGQ